MIYLNPIDAAFLRLETPRTPMHVGGLMTFRLPPDAPPNYLSDLFAFMRSQPVTTPPFNFRLTRGLRSRFAPAWEDAPDLDIDYHLRHSALPYPGGERELGVLVARLHSHPMDLKRPLWECHLIEGLENNRFAIYLKAHHSALDGMATLKLIRNWLSEDPDFANRAGPWALPARERPPEHDARLPQRDIFRHAMELAVSQARTATELAQTLRKMARRKDNPEGGIMSALETPRTLFNAEITAQRRLATQLFDLDRLKALSAATGTTINDIALAICAGAIRRYLTELGQLPEVPVIASVPVGLPRADGKPGNAVAGFVVPLASQSPDPRERLQIIHAVTKRTKEQLLHMSPEALEQFTMLGLSPLILGQMTGLSTKLPPIFNLIVSNVVGSRNKLYFHGAELEAMYPISVLFDGYGLNVTLVGYADKLAVGITGCRNAVPSLQRLAVYTGEALSELEATFGTGAASRTAARRKTAARKRTAASKAPPRKRAARSKVT